MNNPFVSTSLRKVTVMHGGIFIAGGTVSDIPLLKSVLERGGNSNVPVEDITLSANSATSSLTYPSSTASSQQSGQYPLCLESDLINPTPCTQTPDESPPNHTLPTPMNLSSDFSSFPSAGPSTTGQSTTRQLSSSQYMSQYRATKRITQCILSAGATAEEQSNALKHALTHKDVALLMHAVGPIVPKEYAAAIYQHQQKQRLITCAQAAGNKKRPCDDRKTFVYSNIVSVISSPNNKSKHDIRGIMSLTNRSRTTAYRYKKRLASKRGVLIAERSNPQVKWSILPRTIRPKKVSEALRASVVEWILKNSNVRLSPIANDTLLIKDTETGVKRQVPKLLLECSIR
jgi:hypothetical protein